MNNKKVLKNAYFVIAITSLFLIHTVFLACVAEDSYITFRFGQNLAKGHGFVWNIGELPVEGFTNFLWVVICSGLTKLGMPVPILSQVIGVIFSLGTMWVSYQFALNILRLKGWQALLPPLLLACSGPFATWATSGMETNIFGFFLISGCYCYAKYWNTNNVTNLWFSFFILFLATLTRPEGFLIFILLIGLTVLLMPGRTKKTLQDIIPSMAFYLVPFLIYFIWRYNYFGYLLPNTFYAKTGGGIYQLFRGIVHAGYFYIYFILPLILAPILIIISRKIRFGELFSDMSVSKPGIEATAKHLRSYVGQYQCLLIVFTYTAYIIYVGGDYMAMFRFFVPILPLLYLICSYCLATVFNKLQTYNINTPFICGIVFSLVIILIQSTPLEQKLFPKMSNNHGTYRGVQTERWHVNRLALIGRYFNNIKTSYQDSLATGGIGAIAYMADIRIIGLHGLVDTFLAHKVFPPEKLGKGLPGHERGDLPYIFSKKPTYFMFGRNLTKRPSDIPAKLIEEVSDIITNDYKIEFVWLEDTSNNESGYFTYLKKSL